MIAAKEQIKRVEDYMHSIREEGSPEIGFAYVRFLKWLEEHPKINVLEKPANLIDLKIYIDAAAFEWVDDYEARFWMGDDFLAFFKKRWAPLLVPMSLKDVSTRYHSRMKIIIDYFDTLPTDSNKLKKPYILTKIRSRGLSMFDEDEGESLYRAWLTMRPVIWEEYQEIFQNKSDK